MVQGKSFRRSFRFAVGFLAILAWAPFAFAPGVGMAIPLAKIAQQADLIIKAAAISSAPVSDDWFQNYPGFGVYSTRMRVISVVKGSLGSGQIEFHHYGIDRQSRMVSMAMPQLYEFEPGRSYIVFAGSTNQDGVLRQLWKNSTVKSDQGVYLAADETPVGDKEAKDVLNTEFCGMLASSKPKDVLYAIRQLDEMSNPAGRLIKLSDFDRNQALQVISPLLTNPDEQVAGSAIQAIGGSNPYFKDENAIFWLAKAGGRPLPGIGAWESDQNQGAHQYLNQLVEIADGTGSIDLRVMAIRALGRSGQENELNAAVRWAHAPEPRIRAAGTILLADFRGKTVNDLLVASANDPDYQVRKAAARAIGFGQLADVLPVLGKALHDENKDVRSAAALSLVSFHPAQSADILSANINDADYKSVFVNVLAAENAEPYLDALREIIERKLQPPFWSGTIPYADSWNILMKYLQTQRPEILQSSRFARQFDALEKAQIFSSSQPRDLYDFYLKNGMKERAANFREYVRRTAPFDVEQFFKQVDIKYGISKH
jgi:hypothetical protein